MSRLADKLRLDFLSAKALDTVAARYSTLNVKNKTGSAKAGRRRGRKVDQAPRKPRNEGTEDAATHSQLYDILSKSGKRNISKRQDSILAQTSSLFIDTSKIPFLKYTMAQKDLVRFQTNKSTDEERKKVLKVYETILPRRKSQIPMIANTHRRIEGHSLCRYLFPSKNKAPGDVLDSVKERVCDYYLIEESEYEMHKQKAIESMISHEKEKDDEQEWMESYERMMEDYAFSGVALSLKQNPTLSNSARVDIASLLMTYAK